MVTDAFHPQGGDNPNQIFVVAIDAADLPGFVPERFERSGEECGCGECPAR